MDNEAMLEGFKKSTSELLLVIYESILETVGNTKEINQKIFEVLYKEQNGSKEIKKAISQIQSDVVGKKLIKHEENDQQNSGDELVLETNKKNGEFDYELGRLNMDIANADLEDNPEEKFDYFTKKIEAFFVSKKDPTKEIYGDAVEIIIN